MIEHNVIKDGIFTLQSGSYYPGSSFGQEFQIAVIQYSKKDEQAPELLLYNPT